MDTQTLFSVDFGHELPKGQGLTGHFLSEWRKVKFKEWPCQGKFRNGTEELLSKLNRARCQRDILLTSGPTGNEISLSSLSDPAVVVAVRFGR